MRGDIAKRCGVSRQHLYHLIRGEQTPALWTVENIAEGLKLPLATVQAALQLGLDARLIADLGRLTGRQPQATHTPASTWASCSALTTRPLSSKPAIWSKLR